MDLQIAPYLSLLLHGAGWSPAYPRVMTNAQLEIALERGAASRPGSFRVRRGHQL